MKFDADSEVELAKYLRAFSNARYHHRSGIHIYADEKEVRKAVASLQHKESAIDFGCGNGKSSELLRELGFKQVHLVDFITPDFLAVDINDAVVFHRASLWDKALYALPKCDFSVCTDVLEHIPEQHVDQVLDLIADRLQDTGIAYFRIALWGSETEDQRRKAKEKYGGELHVTVKPSQWWLEKLIHRWKYTQLDVWTNPNKPNRRVLIAFCSKTNPLES